MSDRLKSRNVAKLKFALICMYCNKKTEMKSSLLTWQLKKVQINCEDLFLQRLKHSSSLATNKKKDQDAF